MSAARARRRLMAFERYRRHCLDVGANTNLGPGSSEAHALAYWRAQSTGRWAPIGIRADPWTVPNPRCRGTIHSPHGPMRCYWTPTMSGWCVHCRRRRRAA